MVAKPPRREIAPTLADECGQYIFQLGERTFVPIDVADLEGVFESDSIEEFFDNMDPGSATIEEYLTTFGVKPTLDVAKRGYEGSCRVWITHHYSIGDMQAPYATWAKIKDLNGLARFQDAGILPFFDVLAEALDEVAGKVVAEAVLPGRLLVVA